MGRLQGMWRRHRIGRSATWADEQTPAPARRRAPRTSHRPPEADLERRSPGESRGPRSVPRACSARLRCCALRAASSRRSTPPRVGEAARRGRRDWRSARGTERLCRTVRFLRSSGVNVAGGRRGVRRGVRIVRACVLTDRLRFRRRRRGGSEPDRGDGGHTVAHLRGCGAPQAWRVLPRIAWRWAAKCGDDARWSGDEGGVAAPVSAETVRGRSATSAGLAAVGAQSPGPMARWSPSSARCGTRTRDGRWPTSPTRRIGAWPSDVSPRSPARSSAGTARASRWCTGWAPWHRAKRAW